MCLIKLFQTNVALTNALYRRYDDSAAKRRIKSLQNLAFFHTFIKININIFVLARRFRPKSA